MTSSKHISLTTIGSQQMIALTTTARSAWSDRATGLVHNADASVVVLLLMVVLILTVTELRMLTVSQSVSQSLDPSVFVVCRIAFNILHSFTI